MKLLPGSLNSVIAVRLPMDSGIEPRNSLIDRSKRTSLFNFEIVERTLAVKWLCESINSVIAVRLPIYYGIEPDKWQFKRSKCQRDWRLPTASGTFPNIQ